MQIAVRRVHLVSLAGIALTGACTRPAAAPPAPPVVAVDTTPPAPDTLRSHRTPPFRDGPLVVWGPLPRGTRHAERLRSYDLQHQVVRVRFDWARHAVVGSTTLRVAPLPGSGALASVALDAVGMTIGGVTDERGRRLRHDYDGRILTVHLAAPLHSGRASFTVDYETVRPATGAYFIDRRRVVWTQGAAEDTRSWVPTYDYPNDKTTWEIIVRTPAGEKALSNGRLLSSRQVGREREWHWSLTQPASTYLMSIVVGDYVVLQDVWRELPLGYWVYPDSIAAGWRGFGKTPLMVDWASARIGVAYPWAKYDQSVVPDFVFGGMENVTATTQADDRILHPAWAEPQANAEDLVAHELAHQWYGNLLTARDWSHLWLHEGFANFIEALWFEESAGADAGAIKRLEDQEAAIAADLVARRPLVFDRWATDPLELFAGGHIYTRGASVLQMLRRELGDSAFWAGMTRFTTSHRFAPVTTTDFQLAMEAASGRDLAPFFRQWTIGAGFPAFRIAIRFDSLARRLTIEAAQVQPKDSLTGFFRAAVDVEVLTDSGATPFRVEVRDSLALGSVVLPAPPRSIRWDKGGWLLDVADFPRPTVMLAHQLAHDDDPIGRIEAATLLASRDGEERAVTALAAALRRDRMPEVRVRIARALGSHAGAAGAAAALVAATSDEDARVREAAALALGAFAGEPIARRLRALIDADSSRYVRAAAVRSLARVAPSAARPAIDAMLSRRSWLDLERSAALAALATLEAPDAWTVASGLLADSLPRRTRAAAIEALLARSSGNEAATVRALAPLLDDRDPFTRSAAARALGRLGDAGAIAALEKRLTVEAERRVVTALEAALAALSAARR